MLRPAANLVHSDVLHQSLCPRLALLAQSNAVRFSSRRPSESSARASVHTTPSAHQNQPQSQRNRSEWSRSDTSGQISFINQDSTARTPPRIRTYDDTRRPREINSLRNDGSSYVRGPGNGNGNGAGARASTPNRFANYKSNYPMTSAQAIQQMTPPEDDHGDAVNGNPPVTSKTNPVYAKLIRRLQDLANNGTATEVFTHAKFMAEKGYAPTLESYSCLIQACANPKNGSNMQEVALGLLRELKEEGFIPTTTIYHNLLKIFAHSPDYLSLEDLLKEMHSQWVLVSTEGWQYIIQHLLATGQMERAMELFYDRREKGEKVHYNTYMEIIKALGRINEVEEAMWVMNEFQKEWGGIGTTGLQPMAWYELLNIAASNYHIKGVSYIWRKAVQTPASGSTRNTLNPDDGLCLKVLNTAARHGSPKLALEVFRVLTLRKTLFNEHHFAALIGAYAKALDLPSAFRTLTLMRKHGIEPTVTTANSITDALASGGKIEDVDSAFFILKDFAERNNENEVVETAGFNAVIAACCKLGDLERAIGVYNDCGTLGVQPDTDTFNILFAGCVDCSQPPQKDLAMFLANEMKTIGLKPDFVTYEELLRVSLYQEDDYEDAFMYLEEMKELVEGGKVRPMVYEWIAKRLEEKGDPRLPMLIEEMKGLGYDDYVAVWEASLAGQAQPQDAPAPQ
ncbi:hypothetical protein ABW19_dt0207830 [Dactylella cylindrospora]|nr:hypothetical protein ABW19_dt0207830 [Dactylella cylindrospora]